MPKRYGKVKKTYRKRYQRPRKVIKKNTLLVRRSYYTTINQAAGGLDTVGNYYFAMSYIPNHLELVDMFAKVKLLSVDMEWMPAFTAPAPGHGQNNLMYGFNPNNQVSGHIPDINNVLELNGAKTRTLSTKFKFRVYPVCKRGVRNDNTSAGTFYYESVNSNKIFLDDLSFNCPFTGIDWVIPNTGNTAGTALGVWKITYNIVGYQPQ